MFIDAILKSVHTTRHNSIYLPCFTCISLQSLPFRETHESNRLLTNSSLKLASLENPPLRNYKGNSLANHITSMDIKDKFPQGKPRSKEMYLHITRFNFILRYLILNPMVYLP
jgi:hypothetical protein